MSKNFFFFLRQPESSNLAKLKDDGSGDAQCDLNVPMDEHSSADDAQQPTRSFSPMDTCDYPPNAKKANLDESLRKGGGTGTGIGGADSLPPPAPPMIRIEAEPDPSAPCPSAVGVDSEEFSVIQNCLSRCVKLVEGKVMELRSGIGNVELSIAGAYDGRFNQVR